MARGGYREKAGRKTTWSSGCKFENTKIIRVPAHIAKQLLEIAHHLDSGGTIELATKSKPKTWDSIAKQKAIKNVLQDGGKLSAKDIAEKTSINIETVKYHLIILKSNQEVANMSDSHHPQHRFLYFIPESLEKKQTNINSLENNELTSEPIDQSNNAVHICQDLINPQQLTLFH